MENQYIKILLKPKASRTMEECMAIFRFWVNCTPQEFKYAYQLEQFINK